MECFLFDVFKKKMYPIFLPNYNLPNRVGREGRVLCPLKHDPPYHAFNARRDMGQHLLEMKRHLLPNDCNETKAAFDDIISKQKAHLVLNAQLVNHLL